MPKDFRVAKVFCSDRQNRIAYVFRPGSSMICAVGNVLCLFGFCMTCVNSDQSGIPRSAKAARVLPIDDSAAGKDHETMFFMERDRQMFPVDEVAADGMAPAHMSPCIAEWIVLVEQVILTVEEDQSIWIVH